jgi:hypothetical protein
MLLFISFFISCDDGLILFKKHTCQNILTNSIIQKDIYGMGSPSGSLAIMGAGS